MTAIYGAGALLLTAKQVIINAETKNDFVIIIIFYETLQKSA